MYQVICMKFKMTCYCLKMDIYYQNAPIKKHTRKVTEIITYAYIKYNGFTI